MIVVDSSYAIATVYPDEITPTSASVVFAQKRVATALLQLELAHSLRSGLLRKRYTEVEAAHFADAFDSLDIDCGYTSRPNVKGLLTRGVFLGLTPYDATYIDLALALDFKLATLDTAMIRAAKAAGITVYS